VPSPRSIFFVEVETRQFSSRRLVWEPSPIEFMELSGDHEYIPLVPIGVDAPSPASPHIRPRVSARKPPLLKVVTYPLALLFLYLLFILWPEKPTLVDSSYLQYAGKSALTTSIVLPRLQYPFQNGEGRDERRRGTIREVIENTWALYVQEAWGWDEVRPVQGRGRDTLSVSLLWDFLLTS